VALVAAGFVSEFGARLSRSRNEQGRCGDDDRNLRLHPVLSVITLNAAINAAARHSSLPAQRHRIQGPIARTARDQ
jgi:hypothetical protein